MGLPKDYRPREGDVIAVHAEVKFDVDLGDERVHVNIVGAPHCSAVVPLSHVKGIIRRKWTAGDIVRSVDDFDDAGTVAAIGDEWVWVKLDKSDAYVTIHANSLEELPPEPETDKALRARIFEASKPLTDQEAAEKLIGWDDASGTALDVIAARFNITRIGDLP